MQIHANFEKPVFILPSHYDWVESTQSGVTRMMLDRIGAEKARATSLVHYQEDASFPAHAHPGGEEILVLSGTFSDESGDYPKGYYLRNPVGSSHTPMSHEGTLIFVKLWQMNAQDDVFIRVNTEIETNWNLEYGKRICSLYDGFNEKVYLQHLALDEQLISSNKATEILVIEGELQISELISSKLIDRCGEESKVFPKGSWMRLPENFSVEFIGHQSDTRVYIKEGSFKNTLFELTE